MKLRSSAPFVLAFWLSSSPTGPAGAADTETASASASAATAAAPPESLPFVGPVPETKSKPPTPAEWNAAKDIQASISSSDCTVRRVREWIRMRCEIRPGHSIDLVAGKTSEVYFSVKFGAGTCIPDPDEGRICWDLLETVFAMRRGDRRFFQFNRRELAEVYGGFGLSGEPAFTLSEVWLEDEPGPALSVASISSF